MKKREKSGQSVNNNVTKAGRKNLMSDWIRDGSSTEEGNKRKKGNS